MWQSEYEYRNEFLSWCTRRLDMKLEIGFATEEWYPQDWVTQFRWTALDSHESTWEFIRTQLENIYAKGSTISIMSMRCKFPMGQPRLIEVTMLNPLKAKLWMRNLGYAEPTISPEPIERIKPKGEEERKNIALDGIIYQLSVLRTQAEDIERIVRRMMK